MKYKSFLLLSLFIAILSCSETVADLSQADQQIKQKQYALAKQLLLEEQKKSFSDTLQYARIRTRLQRLEQLIFFEKLQDLIFQEKWVAAEQLWHQKQRSLSDSAMASQKSYRFTLFHLHAVIDSALNRPDSMYFFLRKATCYPTRQRNLLRADLEKLAFYVADQDSLVKARRLFDQSLRMAKVSQLDSSLQQAYFLYMDGKFCDCRERLITIPDTLKSRRWQNLQTFLEKYSDRLNLDERFKLW